MARTNELMSLHDLLEQSFVIDIPEQRDDFDTVAYIESLPETYYEEVATEALTARSEDVSAVSCLEEIRIAAELKFEACYDRLQRHGFRPVFTPAEIFSDMDKVIDSQRSDQSIKITAADAEEQVMQAYKDASIHTVIRKVAVGEESNLTAVMDLLENNPVSDGAKVSIAKTFVESIGGQIKATHEASTSAEKQLHARQSLLLTDLAKVSIGHVAVTAEKELPPAVDLRQEFDFLKQVSQEPVRLADYDGRQRGRFTKKATQVVLNSVLAAFSVHSGIAAPSVATEASQALIKSSPISAGTAEKLIDAVSGDEQDTTAKNVISEIVAPHETKNKLVAAANLKLLTVAVEEEIRQKTGNEPVVPNLESENMTANMYLMVADSYVQENGPQLPEDQRQLLTDYAQFMKTIVANNDRLPEGLAQTIVEMAPEGYVTTLRDMAIQSVSEGNTDETNVLMATMFANLDAIVHPSAAEQDRLLAEIMNEPDHNTEEVTPPAPQPTPPTPPEVVPTPPAEETQKTPEELAADQAFLDRVIDLHGQLEGSKWNANTPVRPMDPTQLAEIINKIDAKYNHEAFGRKAALAQLFRESRFDNSAISYRGAEGIAQFMPDTWKEFGNGGDVNDPEAAIDAQFRYMISIYDIMKGHNPTMAPTDLLRLTFAGYNAGPYRDVYKRGEIPQFEETIEYVRIIFEIMGKTTARINEAVEAMSLPEAPAGTRDLGIHDGSREGKPAKVRLVAIPGIPSSSGESQPGNDYYVEGANGELIVNAEIASQVIAMVTLAREQGLNLTVVSSFRTRAHQTQLWNDMGRDRSVVAPPGESDHETGLAIDFSMDGLPIRASAYKAADGSSGGRGNPRVAPESKTYRWLVENAKIFGLVQYWKEPWHWSNRGAPAPTYIPPITAPAPAPAPIDTPVNIVEIQPSEDKSEKEEKKAESEKEDRQSEPKTANDNSSGNDNASNGNNADKPEKDEPFDNDKPTDKPNKEDKRSDEKNGDTDRNKNEDRNYLESITSIFTD